MVEDLLAHGHDVTGIARSDGGAVRVRALGATVFRSDLREPDRLAAAAATADAVVHLGFRHDAAMPEAIETDRAVITELGDALTGSGRPLLVTSGTLVLPTGHLGLESAPADPAAPAGPRGANERTALALAERGVAVSVIRLAPSVHDTERRGFVGALVNAAQRDGFAGLAQRPGRWPALHRRDAATLYRRALESSSPGRVLHGVAEEGVSLRAMAEVIAERLDLPLRHLADDELDDHVGWLAGFVGIDASASSQETRQALGWHPTHPGLLEDLQTDQFFAPAPR